MDSEDTAKAMALSFLLLPPEVRVQIYGYLLISKDGFVRAQLLRDEEYYTGIARARRALSKSRPEYTRRFLPERAILRTCSLIYSEAMAVLYKQNTFRYSCGSSIFNDEDYPKLGFPDQHLDRIKHLQIEVDPDRGPDEIAVDSVAATIEYFVTRGCDLQTFELLLNQMDDVFTESRTGLFREILTNEMIMIALVKLKVSNAVTISIRCYQEDDGVNHQSLSDEFQEFVNRLAFVTNRKVLLPRTHCPDATHHPGEVPRWLVQAIEGRRVSF